jgi:hypothetical protein
MGTADQVTGGCWKILLCSGLSGLPGGCLLAGFYFSVIVTVCRSESQKNIAVNTAANRAENLIVAGKVIFSAQVRHAGLLPT